MAISAYHVISKEVENTSLDTIEFLGTLLHINHPHWQTSGIIVLLCKYDIVILNTLICSFLHVLFLLLAVIFAVLYENPRRRDWVTEKKKKRKTCERNITFLTARPSFYVIFASFFAYSLIMYLLNGSYKDT